MADVPCGTCHECCKHQRILLDADEEFARYTTVPTRHGNTGPTVYMLAHKPNGDCIYLSDQGCTIHDHAPRVCREFDCRVWLKSFDPRLWDIMEDDGLDGAHVTAAKARMEA